MHSRLVKFFVPNYVRPEEIDPLLPYLPEADVPEEMQNKLQSLENSLPRQVGGPLVEAMLRFWKTSDTHYRAHSKILDAAYHFLANDKYQYMTLAEIAKGLLHVEDEANISSSLMYAVHRALMQDSIGFHPQGLGNVRSWGQFEIAPVALVENIKEVGEIVRSYQEEEALSARLGKPIMSNGKVKAFRQFIARAQALIEFSRTMREATEHGQIGPYKSIDLPITFDGKTYPTKPLWNVGPNYVPIEGYFRGQDESFIAFIHSWAALRTFNDYSPANGTASTILRATQKYKNQPLDASTGWMFLQELGILFPWQTRQLFDLRHVCWTAPIAGPIDTANLAQYIKKSSLSEDPMGHLRKNWGNLPVYCIDDESAHEIDDGVSIECIEGSNDHWIHVHIADPASALACDSDATSFAERETQSLYLPDYVFPMLPKKLVFERDLSLCSSSPTLTFSAKLNEKGDLLEYHVRPGRIENVIYITPQTLAAVAGYPMPDANNLDVEVGTPSRRRPRRKDKYKSPEQLSESDKENLQQLSTLGNARRILASFRGGIFLSRNELKLDVSAGWACRGWMELKTRKLKPDFVLGPDLPAKLSIPSIGSERSCLNPTNPVMSLMLLGSEVAARWCRDRNIPIIYRVTQQNPDAPSPAAFFEENILPFYRCGQQPPEDIVSQYLRIVGAVLPSTTPGPHVALGLDLYAKATSPLRRFSDMLLHYQIEAALLEEAKTGQSLVGSTRQDYLPYSKEKIDAMIPHIDSKEKAMARAQRDAERTWALQLLLRMWKFKQAPLPEIFTFDIMNISHQTPSGYVKELGLQATMAPKKGHCAQPKVGDVWEVQIKDLNVYKRTLTMEAVRRISSDEDVVETASQVEEIAESIRTEPLISRDEVISTEESAVDEPTFELSSSEKIAPKTVAEAIVGEATRVHAIFDDIDTVAKDSENQLSPGRSLGGGKIAPEAIAEAIIEELSASEAISEALSGQSPVTEDPSSETQLEGVPRKTPTLELPTAELTSGTIAPEAVADTIISEANSAEIPVTQPTTSQPIAPGAVAEAIIAEAMAPGALAEEFEPKVDENVSAPPESQCSDVESKDSLSADESIQKAAEVATEEKEKDLNSKPLADIFGSWAKVFGGGKDK
jgi:hypothetical protein